MKALIVAFLITSSTGFAHGEQKAGPHGGEIRMPGLFHTEVLSPAKNKLKVYLLDMKFQSPSTVDSAVQVKFKGNQTHEAVCVKQDDFFNCEFDEAVMNTAGELHITATRNNHKGSMVHYATPLKF
jgi:hypothetical protein